MPEVGLLACTDRPVLTDAKQRAGALGGQARTASLTPEERKQAASLAAKARWVEWRRRRRIEAGY